jgi:hypothetical protein
MKPKLLSARAAFSLIEIMVTVALMTLIVLGLLTMFNQTQRAFRSSMTQVDVLESGRAFTDLLTRELEQTTPSRLPFVPNFIVERSTTFVRPLLQDLTGTTQRRMNVVQRFFFLSQVNQDWTGTGYQVIPPFNDAGVGTLYRYTVTQPKYSATNLYERFLAAPLTNLNRVVDGVVHLRVQAYDTNGVLITWPFKEMYGVTNRNVPGQAYAYFTNNAVPAFVELELGILEPEITERFRSLSDNPIAARNYLEKQASRVHIFRQRVPIRNVDFSAYQ